jgi:tripartite-type tricarboxylate transporter receptor subunit TctC
MKSTVPQLLSLAFLTGGIWAAATSTHAADAYPTRPITIISPFSAGSPPDAFGRLIAQQLSGKLGQNVVVENRPGAGTTLGTKAGALAAPDGYTLTQVNAALSYGPVLYSATGYDPVKSFVPIALLASWTHVLVAHPSVQANTLQELIAYAKANPGQVNIGSPLGSPPHLLAHMLRLETGADFNDVPYRQNPQLVSDLIAGRLQIHFSAGEPIGSMIRDGKMKAYAVTGATRDPLMPNVPTMAEAGLPALTADPSDWTGLLAPAGTPPEIIAKLNSAVNDVLQSPEVRVSLTKLGWGSKATTSADFAGFVSDDAKRWPRVVKAAALKAE